MPHSSQQKTNPNLELRQKHREAYKPWTTEQDDTLTVMYNERVPIRKMANHFGRTIGAIRSRINKLALDDL